MSTVQQVAAQLTKQATDSFASVVKATPPEKQEWKPLDAGRTVLAQAQEVAAVTAFFTKIIVERAVPAFDGAYERAMAELDTMEKALAALDANTADLLAAIEAFPDAELTATVTMPWSPVPATLECVLLMNYWNLVYHYGQISYIQTLYGDREMH